MDCTLLPEESDSRLFDGQIDASLGRPTVYRSASNEGTATVAPPPAAQHRHSADRPIVRKIAAFHHTGISGGACRRAGLANHRLRSRLFRYHVTPNPEMIMMGTLHNGTTNPAIIV